MIRGESVGLTGRLDGPCDDLQAQVGDTTVAQGVAAEDGRFDMDLDTVDLPLGEHTATVSCADQPLGEVQFIVSQPVDGSDGPAEAGLLLSVLLFFMLSCLLAVSVPLPRPDTRQP